MKRVGGVSSGPLLRVFKIKETAARIPIILAAVFLGLKTGRKKKRERNRFAIQSDCLCKVLTSKDFSVQRPIYSRRFFKSHWKSSRGGQMRRSPAVTRSSIDLAELRGHRPARNRLESDIRIRG